MTTRRAIIYITLKKAKVADLRPRVVLMGGDVGPKICPCWHAPPRLVVGEVWERGSS
jgi:hypothetical protein